MSDIRIYSEANMPDSPLTGDVVICSDEFNSAPANSVHLATTGGANPTWKSFANDSEVDASQYPNHYAVNIDGTNDYINCGGVSDFSFTDGAGNDSAFSVSVWAKFDNINKGRLVGKDTSTSNREFIFGTDGSSLAGLTLGVSPGHLKVSNTTALNTTDWFNIVATYDGSKSASGLKVYVNADDSNRLVVTNSYSGMSSTSGNLEIGRFANGHSYFNGLIDEVAVFNYVLSSTQVTSIYNDGTTTDLSSLSPLGWWRMGDNDDGTGTTITDQGSGGNNGTLVNGADFHDLSLAPDTIYVA